MTDPVCNVRFFLIVGNQRDYLRLGENRTHTGDLDLFCGSQGNGSQFIQRNLQGTGDHFQETACACGAFVVHDEILHLSLFI